MAQRTALNKTIYTNLVKYADLLKEAGFRVSHVLLFGSFATDSAQEHSDVDVCVVSPDFGKDIISETVSINKLAHKVDVRMEVIPYTPSDLAVEEDPLASQIRKHGIVVYP